MAGAGRAVLGAVSRVYEIASGSGNPHRFVMKGTSDIQVKQATGSGVDIIGVLQPDLKRSTFEDGDPCSVAPIGIVNVEAGAAVAVGKRVTSDSVGRAIEAAALSVSVDAGAVAVTSTAANGAITTPAGGVLPERVGGVALTAAAAAGDIIEVAMAVR